MFLAVPVEHKPSLKSPPWVTIALIVINVLIYFGWQVGEETAVHKAADYYAETTLPAMELPRLLEYVKHKNRQDADTYSQELIEHVENSLKEQEYGELYVFMWHEQEFRRDLLAGKIIKAEDEQYEKWRAARQAFNAREPKAFTARWAQDYSLHSVAEVLERPMTLLTSTFLHGGFMHLLGNMVFLFIFGFTLEKTLGASLYLGGYLLAGVGASLMAAWAYAGNGGYGLGASGAISGLMGMYAVLYRLQRIRFFYYILFYFNYARLPALVMLPVWMGYELVQSAVADSNVAYMAHFGGLLCGAVLMALISVLTPVQERALQTAGLPVDVDGTPAAAGAAPRAAKHGSHAEDDAAFAALVARARAQTQVFDFRAASKSWRAAAKLRPKDTRVLQAWFDVARHWPESDDFHTSAQMLFQLRAHDEPTRLLQQHAYKIYLAQAKPFMRLRTVHMVQLARAFIVLGDLDEAERLCRLLERNAANRPEVPALASQLATAWAKAGRVDLAQAWLPALQRLAPGDPMTAWLATARKQTGNSH